MTSRSAAPASTVEGSHYISSLSHFIRSHEFNLAQFNRSRRPAATATASSSYIPSWSSILTLGLVSSGTPGKTRQPQPLVLKFDPHHLYYLLLRFDELGIPGIGNLDVLIDGGPSRPMSYAYFGSSAPPGAGASSSSFRRQESDNISLRSTFSTLSSSFSLRSTWWASSAPRNIPSASDAAAAAIESTTVDIKYLYSSCTKLPALRLTPFSFSATATPTSSSSTLSKAVRDFEDCPPPNTAVPLYCFKNLQSLILEDLDPRAFLGWDILSAQLRSLEVKQSGIEDVGELICDAVIEDFERRIQGRGGVGLERRKRRSHASEELHQDDVVEVDSATADAYYRTPPPSAWQSLVHLSLSCNSLTFIPAPPLVHLVALTSLDLSSNLLISIPPALASLPSLRLLNLSDNMIDSLTGVSKALMSIVVLNLSSNRIDNLSGLERLDSLQRLDLRRNRLVESLEVSRLAVVSSLTEIWIECNPFSRSTTEGGEDGYRIKCFNYFMLEGNRDEAAMIKIDDALPSMTERRSIVVAEKKLQTRSSDDSSHTHERSLESPVSKGRGTTFGFASLGRFGGNASGALRRNEEAQMASSVTATKVVVGRRSNGAGSSNHPHHPRLRPSLPNLLEAVPSSSSTFDSSIPSPTSPTATNLFLLSSLHKPRRRKPHRIVEFAAPVAAVAASSCSGGEDVSGSSSEHAKHQTFERGTTGTPPTIIESATGGHPSSEESALPELLRRPFASSIVSPHKHLLSTSSVSRSLRPDYLSTPSSSSRRRDRVSASSFEAPTQHPPSASPPSSSSGNDTASSSGDRKAAVGGNGHGIDSSSDAYRRKIEALRSHVGENWMTTLAEMTEKKRVSDLELETAASLLADGKQREVDDAAAETAAVIRVVGKGRRKKEKEKGKEKVSS